METIIITGGAGFIGSHVCEALLEKKNRIICIDNFNDYYPPERKRENISKCLKESSFFLEECDITDYESLRKVFERHHADKVVHLAARAGVRPSVENPYIYEKTNILGTLNLLELSKDFEIKNFVFGSSSSVYGSNLKIPFSEDDRTDDPISPYAATKKAGELLCRVYGNLYGLKGSCLRFFTVYGPRGRPDMAPYIFTKNISEGMPITVYGKGDSKRDYTYVADIVSGIISALEKPFSFEVFNLGNSVTVELRELIAVIERHTGKKAKIIEKDPQKGDVPITYSDISKAKKLLGYSPKTGIGEGIKNFVEWYNKQQNL